MKLTNLSKQHFKKILKDYETGKYKHHKRLSDVLENEVYILKTTKGKFIVKILKNINLKHFHEQLDLIDFLYRRKIPVVENIKNKKGEEIIRYGKEKIIMQRFVEGIHPKIMPNPLIKDIARNIGKMHLLLLKSKFKVKRKSIHRYKKRDLGKYTDENIKEMQKELLINLKKFKSKKLKTARIHSDLSEINLIAKNNKLKAMIDWDDSDYDYLAYEIAIFIAHSFVRSKVIHKDKIKLFLKEYQKHIRLNDDEKRLVYYLIEYRLFGILYWNIKYIKLYPEKSKSLKRGIKRSAARLENFKKLSLEEFLEWFK